MIDFIAVLNALGTAMPRVNIKIGNTWGAGYVRHLEFEFQLPSGESIKHAISVAELEASKISAEEYIVLTLVEKLREEVSEQRFDFLTAEFTYGEGAIAEEMMERAEDIRIMKAAPELLEACKQLLANSENYGDGEASCCGGDLEEMERAVAKAEGNDEYA